MQAYSDFAYIYDALMRDVDYGAWAAYVISMLGGVHTVADCGCGTGEITVRLADAGYSVTGVDASPDMLELAAEKARRHGQRIQFVCQDMAELCLMRPVDAVISVCDGVNYLDNPAAAAFFNRAARWLSPGGLLLFDISSEYKLKTVIGDNTVAEDDGERAFIWTNEPGDGCVDMEISFFVREGELFRRFTEEHTQYIHTVPELCGLLNDAGFDIINIYDAFTVNAPTDKSERIQFAARRRGGE